MYALSFLERRKVRGQIMANMWMVPQGRVHIRVYGRNFVAVKAWLACQSIALSLCLSTAARLCHPSVPVMKRAAMKHVFHEKGPSLTFSCLHTFPSKIFLPFLWQTENPLPAVHDFQTPMGLLYSGLVPCSTACFCCDYWMRIWTPA